MQIHPQSDPRREIAAYRIDRLLGIGHVPPAKSAAFAIEDLIAAADPANRGSSASRIEQEGIPREGKLCGELSWWIPEIKRVRIGGRHGRQPHRAAPWARAPPAAGARPPAPPPR